MLVYPYKACELGMTEKIVEMAINASGIQDIARVLKINKNTVINTLKKSTYRFLPKSLVILATFKLGRL